MPRIDEGLQALVKGARDVGHLTFQEIDAFLPDEGGDPTLVDQLVLALEEESLGLKDEPDQDEAVPVNGTVPASSPSDPHSEISPLARSLMTPETSALSSRDPIRMYLSQMGNIPLLSRDREIFLAKQIEITRKRFRRTVLESDFALSEAVAILEKVHAQELPFERTLRTSETENVQKEQILGRMPHNLKTLNVLLEKNRADYELLTAEGTGKEEKAEIRKRMLLRRRKMCTLCEELSLRTQRLQPIMKRMLQMGERIAEAERADPEPQRSPRGLIGSGHLPAGVGGVPGDDARKRRRSSAPAVPRSSAASTPGPTPSKSSRAGTCGSSCPSPRSTATAACAFSTSFRKATPA